MVHSKRAEQLLSYSIAQLRQHLERQFSKGMTWQAFCAGEIHIDHIVPLVCFNLADINEWQAAWALTNLRPLLATDNLKKGDKHLHLL